MDFVFLVLHYMNADITKQCIDSIIHNIVGDYSVVVVDNASNNGSVEQLRDEYSVNENIHFLVNEENLGYAAGNNVGFMYAKTQLNASYICLANNDLVFQSGDFIERIKEYYTALDFYVLGPDIVTPEGIHQNPYLMQTPSKYQVRKKLYHDVVVWSLLRMKLYGILKKWHSAKKSAFREELLNSDADFKGVLHGSCLVFSPKYINEFDGLFSGTFLYAEEEILCYILRELDYKYVYINDITVEHRHATSLRRAVADEETRKRIILEHRIKSYTAFMRIMKSGTDLHNYLKVNKNE